MIGSGFENPSVVIVGLDPTIQCSPKAATINQFLDALVSISMPPEDDEVVGIV